MAKIIPFKAVRPAPDKIGLVSCRNYEDYSAAELAAWLNFNPYSFLHVINPAYDHVHSTDLNKRFKGVALKYNDFKNQAVFIEEECPSFYVYEIQSKNNTFTGIIAGTSVEEYKNNSIKKHENTLEYRVEMFKNYLEKTQFNTEPVLITYPDSTELNTWILLKKQSNPLYCFSTTNKEKHSLWKIDTQSDIDWLQEHFEEIPSLYIADGHHRSASSEKLYDAYKNSQNNKLNYFMSFLIAESNVKIYEFNRMITDLNGYTVDNFLKKISENFLITSKEQEIWKPQKKFDFGMYLNEQFYSLSYKFSDQIKTQKNSILNQLDAQILYDTILNPILGIGDLRTDERIEYIPGNKPITKIKEIIDNGEFKVAFMLYPSNIKEIKELADNDLIMPPKSTYIEPKFRSGLIVYEL